MSPLRTVIRRLVAGRNAGLAAASATFGIPATVAGLAGIAGVPLLCSFGALSVTVGVAFAYVKGEGQILPRNLLAGVRNTESPYSCAFCTEASLAEACELTKPHYRDEYVSGEHAEQWRKKNPRAFVQLNNRDGDLVASFGVLALTTSFTDQFQKGNVTDHLLKADDVLDFVASRKARQLYISGVVVRDPDTHLGHKRTVAMLWVMSQYLERLYGTRRKRTLFAIAVTPASERLLKGVGFSIGCRAKDRQDHYPLYCFELNPDSWKDLRAKIGAFGGSSLACNCDALTRR